MISEHPHYIIHTEGKSTGLTKVSAITTSEGKGELFQPHYDVDYTVLFQV